MAFIHFLGGGGGGRVEEAAKSSIYGYFFVFSKFCTILSTGHKSTVLYLRAV